MPLPQSVECARVSCRPSRKALPVIERRRSLRANMTSASRWSKQFRLGGGLRPSRRVAITPRNGLRRRPS